MRHPKVVVIAGGKGATRVIEALKPLRCRKVQVWDLLRVITNMSDDGGSTGRISQDQDSSPWGDPRRAIAALAPSDSWEVKLFGWRFAKTTALTRRLVGLPTKLDLSDESFGNIFLAAAEQLSEEAFGLEGTEEALRRASRWLNIRGAVYPCSLERLDLVAELEDGSRIYGQSKISHDTTCKSKIKRVWVELAAGEEGGFPVVNPAAVRAIEEAGLIIIGPGALHASILAAMVVPGIAQALSQSQAYKLYVLNTAIRWQETKGFGPEAHVRAILNHVHSINFNLVVVNNRYPSVPEEVELLHWDEPTICSIPVLSADLIDESDLASGESYYLHDPAKIRAILSEILERSERR